MRTNPHPPSNTPARNAPAGRASARRRALRSPLIWIAGAFALGLLLCLWVLMRGRETGDEFFRVGTDEPAATAPQYKPLPAPLPAGEADTIGMPEAPTELARGEAERNVVEERPAPPPPKPVRREPPRAVSVRPEPIPGQTPSPRYPVAALRRGDEGTVLVRAEVGPDGVPTSTSLARSSGSRDLDRAAVDAVRRWRFTPAMVDGRPTVDSVLVPIEFKRE